jgi:hypothetical protein
MSLRIKVEQAHAKSEAGQGCGQIHRCGRFPDAPFLIEDGDPSHPKSPRYRGTPRWLGLS